ncbi:MAG TPA: type III pantothenate kinase [Steroidobacteraceae bacterium]|jgi:type III pantothenate kinase|nr:type III pantothenate kinase [Steroidobacteraceae bacterium]
MTTLLVDIGNTRVKWATLRGTVQGRMQAAAHENSGLALRALVRGAPRDVSRVVVVSVVDEALSRVLDAAVLRRFRVTPEYIASARRAHGVTNSYRDVWRLGADRWVSAVGAHAQARGRTVVIANVGTALTIDAVTAKGRHRGGAIAPGPEAMVETLLSGTHGIRRRAAGGGAKVQSLFATDTAGALAAGSVFAAAAFIDRALTEAAKTLGGRPLLILTGGGAPALKRYIKSPARLVPDLVLRGLAVFAQS